MAGTLKNETRINNISVNRIAIQEILFEIFGRIKSTIAEANMAIAAKPMAIMPFETREEFLLAMIKAKPINANNMPGVSKAIIEAIAPNIPCALNPIIAANLTPVSPGNRKVIPNMLPNSAASTILYFSTNVSWISFIIVAPPPKAEKPIMLKPLIKTQREVMLCVFQALYIINVISTL